MSAAIIMIFLEAALKAFVPRPNLVDLLVFLACCRHQFHHPGTVSGLVAPEAPWPAKRIALLLAVLFAGVAS